MQHIRLAALVALVIAPLTWGQPVFGQVGNNQGLLDPNLAEASQLSALPHMTEALVASVIAGRPYRTAAALDAVLAGSLAAEQRGEIYARLFRQIDLNTATRAEIMLIPDMSKRLAHEFEEYRPYSSLEQFRREMKKYVDDAELVRLEQYVFVPIDLNSASEEVIATIPGMTPKLAHEIEEYRPYSSMDQFRREIGKYVDEAEVARLESYVTIR